MNCSDHEFSKVHLVLEILHGGAKIWILSSSGENNILRMNEASE